MAKSKAIFFGFNPPFLGGPQNVLSRQEDDRLIKNDILQLLLTVPGERVMRPLYGVPLRSFVFEQSTSSDIDILRSQIIDAITETDKRVTVEEVTIDRDDERNGINIKVVVRLKKDLKRVLTVEHFLTGRT
jgi:phage baseplate assembly protein W